MRNSKYRTALVSLALVSLLVYGSDALSQSTSDCLTCHNERSLSMTRKGKDVPLFVDGGVYKKSAHGELDCVSCHTGFDPSSLPHARRIKPVDCSSCHSDAQFLNYRQSVHGMIAGNGKQGAACPDCHSTHGIRNLTGGSPAERHEFAVATCSKCHVKVHDRYMESDHGRALAAGVPGAPSCIDCHGEHEVSSPASDSSTTSRKKVAEMCIRCHQDNPDVRAKVGPSAGFIASYDNSVHAKAVHSGNDLAATCTDCHGSHDMKKGSNPNSGVARTNIAATCGRCHGDIQEQYDGSIHGKALASGISASATCTDCHGEHNILSPKDASSPVAARNVSARVCAPCHASVKLTSKYGLASDRFASFEDSYHGLANAAGSVEVANCGSCHGIHDIKPSTDSTSRISQNNLVKTCGTCHPGANDNFTRGSVHVIAISGQDDVLYFVASAYVLMIALTIGGMLFHNVIDFVKKSRHQLMIRRGEIPHPRASHRLYLRMTLNERFQHATLLISFILLVVTGFALRFPDAWWVAGIRDLSPWVFYLRGVIHRVSAVVMVLASLYHLYYIIAVPRGKQLLRDLLPVRQDLTDALGVMKYNLGFSETKPKLGRFSYVEKAEYWALIWGTAVMTFTGIVLWFENVFIGLLTKLGWDVARTVHYYEAWLATLAIIVWHFYFVILNPETYPINLAFLKGTLTEREMEEEHPAELEEIKRRENAERQHEESQA
jgi:cytochrome b subunit of formate dehydrogenase/nitrate/TMAO reductase-like tetraheme cytochrome c subunit